MVPTQAEKCASPTGLVKTETIDYVGKPNGQLLVNDFTGEQRRDFTIRKTLLLAFPDSTDNREITRHEVALILQYESNNPAKG